MEVVMRSQIAVLILASACGKMTTSFPDPQQGMRFTSGEFGRAHTASTKHVDLPFQLKPGGINGTALLLGFLQSVAPSGASYISEVSYSLQLVYRGVPVECTSKIIVDDGTQPPPAPPPPTPAKPDGESDEEYATTVAPWRPEQDDRWVIDRELACHKSTVVTTHSEHRYAVEYNAEAKRNVDPLALTMRQDPDAIPSREVEVTDATFFDVCKLDPTKKYVHRYEHFLAAKFAPPDLARVQKQYSDFKLVEAPPQCHRIERAAGAPLRQHITADLHFMGSVEPREPTPDHPLTGYH
jgi:hypothetical protein